MYSIPFGKHNAALPEMKFKVPSLPNERDSKLSYYDVLDKLHYEVKEEDKKNDDC